MKNKKLAIILVVLIAVVGIFAYANNRSISNTSKQDIIIIKYNGSQKEMSLAEIKKSGETTFKKELISKGGAAKQNEYTGVEMKKVLKSIDENILNENSNIVLTAKDGYKVSYKGQEILDDNNIYIVFKENGKEIKDKKTNKTMPFMTVVCKDKFAQRWCKDLVEIDIN
jgi:hypothetical protein